MLMADGQIIDEQHECIVCGKLYTLKVTYDAEGRMLSCVAISPGVRVLLDPNQPLAACVVHSGSHVGAALAQRYFGPLEHDHDHDHEHEHEDMGEM
jgi:hypothetical protein